MNIFEEFMTFREVTVEPGKITMDKQRVIILPVSFIGLYTLRFKSPETEAKKLYEIMKKGMIDYSVPIGKEYGLSSRDYLDRWVKYCGFGGWGTVSYKLVETEGVPHGVVEIKNMPLHMYIKSKGATEASSDPLFDGLIAGSLSTTFKQNIDVIEVKCICAGNESCVYYWGSSEYLMKTLPDLAKKRLSDKV